MRGRAAPARGHAVTAAQATVDDAALRQPAITPREFQLYQKLVYREAGIWLGPQKKALVVSRLGRRLRELGLQSFGAYYDVVRERGESELIYLLDHIATNETHFFREPRHFELLVERIIPSWTHAAVTAHRPRVVRVWSAACSTGEEPYSLAMTLLHHLPMASGWEVEILATDLSTRALASAREAVWPMERAREIPAPYLKRFMLRGRRSQTGKLKAGPELRRVVSFARLNLNDAVYPAIGRFDLVFCRNVLIYFDAQSKTRVIDQVLRHLAPDGHLFLGHAETLNGVASDARMVIPTVYTRATTGARPAGLEGA
jgi:chemotaxis protein methyltransferase CheR